MLAWLQTTASSELQSEPALIKYLARDLPIAHTNTEMGRKPWKNLCCQGELMNQTRAGKGIKAVPVWLSLE